MDLCNGGFEMSMRKCAPELISETHVGKPLMHPSETHVDSNGLIVTNGIDSELLNCVTLYQPLGTENGGEEVVEGGAVAIVRQLVRVFPQPNNRIPSPEVVQRESHSPRAVNPIPHFFIDKLQAISNVMGRSPPWTNRATKTTVRFCERNRFAMGPDGLTAHQHKYDRPK